MSSLAAAKADNFYYPPDFDPKKHQTLNKYNGQHPLRERASKLDQGILVIRFEIPFNIWCDKCGEHIAKGERFNAEKKAIGQYHSTKVLQFTMSHHCGGRITIQTDPKRAEYLVVEGARKKEESYSAADAEVIELPDEAERERRSTDPLYRLEYQQGAMAKALTGAERLVAIYDAVDVRAADPYSLNRTMRAALRGEKRAAAALDARRRELGLSEAVSLLAASDGDALAAQVAFLTSSSRAAASVEARRKRILEEDIFVASGGLLGGGDGGSGGVVCTRIGETMQPPLPPLPAAKRPAVGVASSRAYSAAAAAAVVPGAGAQASCDAQEGPPVQDKAAAAVQQQQEQRWTHRSWIRDGRTAAGQTSSDPEAGAEAASGSGGGAVNGRRADCGAPQGSRTAAAADAAAHPCRGAAAGCSGRTTAAAAASGGGGGRPPPGSAALVAAAARAAALSQPSCKPVSSHAPTAIKLSGLDGASAHRPAGAHAAGRSQGLGPSVGLGGAAAAQQKRSLKDRAAELHKRLKGHGGVGLTLLRPEL